MEQQARSLAHWRFSNKPTRDQSTVYWSTRGLEDSHTSQLADIELRKIKFRVTV